MIRLSDIVTGDVIIGGQDTQVVSGDGLLAPVARADGYFVFTDSRTDRIRVMSKTYHGAVFSAADHPGGVLHAALIPRVISGPTVTVTGDAYIGFYGKGMGYALAVTLTESSREIFLQKEDFRDLTDRHHLLVSPDGGAERIYLEKNLGSGRYCLRAPPQRGYQIRGTRLIPLWRTAGGQIPVPPFADTVYQIKEGALSMKRLAE